MPNCPRKVSTAIRNDLEIFKDYQSAEFEQLALIIAAADDQCRLAIWTFRNTAGLQCQVLKCIVDLKRD